MDLETLLVTIGIAVVSGDALSGVIPDKWLPYVGLVRRVVRKIISVKNAKQK